jgi:deoxyribodipyrimidine photo-lyase
MTYRVVWFKRDLRLHDHAALAHAAQQGPVLCLYVVEPGLWAQPDSALQHFEFVHESLIELHNDLQALGGSLVVRTGHAVQVLSDLYAQAPFIELVAHQETGNAFTYERDLQVGAWCRSVGVGWTEMPQFGVVRRLKSRNTWQSHWEAHMGAPQAQLPALHFVTPAHHSGPEAMTPPPGLQHNPPQRQRGGRSQALKTLHSFQNARALSYRGGISSPLSSPTACSRISTYLAWAASACARWCKAPAPRSMPCRRRPLGTVLVWSASSAACIGIATSSKSWKVSRRLNGATCTGVTTVCAKTAGTTLTLLP